MKKIELKGLDATLYYEKLENGLECYLLPYQNKNNYYMTYATKFGSNQTRFIPKGEKEMCKVPDGIAHFLEHKMFEQEDGIDPFSFFAQSGTGANASTTFDSTQYLCFGTKNIEENLDYLLNYVNEPYFTDENVEKEKGIIREEIKMYDDIPEWVLEDELRKALFHVHPMRVDIAGSVEEINHITKEDLYRCYEAYYQPSNMFLIVSGKFDPDKIMEVIRQNKSMNKNFNKFLVQEEVYEEPDEVEKTKQELKMNVVIPKIGFALKFNRLHLKIKDDCLLDMYLQMFTSLVFGTTSSFREKVLSQHLLASFYMQWDHADQFRTLCIMAETKEPEKLLQMIHEELKNITILEEDVKRIKKVWISSEVQMIDLVEASANNLYDDIIKYNHPIYDKIDLIKKMSAKELTSLLQSLDFKNSTEIIVWPKEQESIGK